MASCCRRLAPTVLPPLAPLPPGASDLLGEGKGKTPPLSTAAIADIESVEALVAHIQGLSGSAEELAHLHSLLKQADGESLRAHSAGLLPFLSQLDPSIHSLGFLYLLEVFASSTANLRAHGGGDFLVTVADFLTSCSADQICMAPDRFLNVCKVFKSEVMQLNAPIRGIAPLQAGVRKIQTSSEQLTPIHADYLLLCLLAKQYKAGLSVLEDDIFDVDQPKDLFLYCYYGGMIYIRLKKFPKALELLHNAVTAPMSSLNAIAVEAYRKYVLVSLIHNEQAATAVNEPQDAQVVDLTADTAIHGHLLVSGDLMYANPFLQKGGEIGLSNGQPVFMY